MRGVAVKRILAIGVVLAAGALPSFGAAEGSPLLLHAAYLKPTSPYPWVHLAFVALHAGDAALAERCCAKAASLGPDDPWVRTQIANVRAKSVPPPLFREAGGAAPKTPGRVQGTLHPRARPADASEGTSRGRERT